MSPKASSRMHPVRVVAAIALFLFLVAACGQKPGVHVAGAGGAGAGGGDGSLDAAPGDQGTSGDQGGAFGETTGGTTGGTTGVTTGGTSGGTTGVTTGGSDGGTTGGSDGGTTGGTTGGSDGGTTGGTTGGSDGGTTGGGGQNQPRGSDRTGVTDEKIVLAQHAPATGAAPLPVTSFREAKDLYWRWRIEKKKQPVLGRNKVEVLFRDDKYDPNSAVQVCRELADKAFHLTGGGGTDQISACGQYAEQAGVPYFSAGVTEAGLVGNPWYFAGSMSYRQQGILLAQFIKKNMGSFKHKGTYADKVAMVVTDTANFDDAVEGFKQGVEEQGLDFYGVMKHTKNDDSWYSPYANDLEGANVGVVYPLTSPVDYIQFAQTAAEQDYFPQFVGVGITMGLNAVLPTGCPEVDGGIFFSPFPGLDWAKTHQPEFFEAAEDFETPSDDIALALWGLAKQQAILFDRYGQVFGNDLTREDFRAATEQQTQVQGGVFPEVSYSPDDHFGAASTHVLQADCGADPEQHVTLATFMSSF